MQSGPRAGLRNRYAGDISNERIKGVNNRGHKPSLRRIGNRMAKLVDQLEPGAVVTLSTERIPLPGFRFTAAVEALGEGQFRLFSTEVGRFQLGAEGLTFDVNGSDFRLLSVEKASEAVPRQSGGFQRGDRIRVIDRESGKEVLGNVVAAHNGLVHATTDEGISITGSAQYFDRVIDSKPA